jgi:hypothetical protein
MGIRNPNETPPQLSPALRAARTALDWEDGVDVLREWEWDSKSQHWTLLCRLTVDTQGAGEIPARTDWVILAEKTYPWGGVHLQPSAENGLQGTYPHQFLNRRIPENNRWLSGRLCVDTGIRSLGRQGLDPEPFDPGSRLKWRLQRARLWLLAAANGELFLPGDAFELPDYSPPLREVVGYGESVSSFGTWTNEPAQVGVLALGRLVGRPSVRVALRYQDLRGRNVYDPRWGSYISQSNLPQELGLWLRLKEVPKLAPWQAPMTWGELRKAVGAQGLNLDTTLDEVLYYLRDGEKHVLQFGFPIPSIVGGTPTVYHWQALELEAIAPRSVTKSGFRPGKAPALRFGELWQFRDDASIKWLRSENWHAETIAARGRFSQTLTTAEILLIGGGALGAAVAELLTRGGVENLTICDPDLTTVGNLVRHTLTLADVSDFKAVALSSRLNSVSPQARVQGIAESFPSESARSLGIIRTVDVVIDCSGENEVVAGLAGFPWNGDKFFFSVSLGLYARRGFVFAAYGETFPVEEFFALLSPALESQAQEFRDVEWPREGVGCWHPLFPARVDEVWTLAALAVDSISRLLETDLRKPELIVLERKKDSLSIRSQVSQQGPVA